MIKVQSMENSDSNDNSFKAMLFADTKNEVVSGTEIIGLPIDATLEMGSCVLTADGDVGFLKSNGEWNWVTSGGSGSVIIPSKSVTENGTYKASDDNGDGYAQVVVNVSTSGVVLSGTSNPSNNDGQDEDIYVKYSLKQVPPFNHTVKIEATYRKENGVWVTYTNPRTPISACHVWTHSTGEDDASIWVQAGFWNSSSNAFIPDGNAVSVIFSDVSSQGSEYNCNNIGFLWYPSYWQVGASMKVTDGTNTFNPGDEVKWWSYTDEVDFYFWQVAE